MIKKAIIMSGLLIILNLAAFAQEALVKNEGNRGSTGFVTAESPESAAKTALKAGGKMPAFELKDALGKTVKSEELLKQGNVVLVFYRGSWCPFCNVYLRKLQQNLSQIKSNKGVLVAVSVENPDNSLTVAKKNELEFTVLSDANLDVARQFGIVYQLAKATDELYKSHGLDIAKHNAMNTPELPLSATYIINQKGEIIYAFLEPDYKKRAEPQVIIETLSKIK